MRSEIHGMDRLTTRKCSGFRYKEPNMSFDIIKGMATTLKNMGKKPTTVSYPEEERELPPRFRGRHVLHRYENGLERCVGCYLCAGACPADAIYIEAEENT